MDGRALVQLSPPSVKSRSDNDGFFVRVRDYIPTADARDTIVSAILNVPGGFPGRRK